MLLAKEICPHWPVRLQFARTPVPETPFTLGQRNHQACALKLRMGETNHGGPSLCCSSRQRLAVTCRAEHKPFAFDQTDYYKCVLQVASYNDPTQGPAGNLIFMQETEVRRDPDGMIVLEDEPEKLGTALVMGVGGDTLHCIVNLLRGGTDSRPFALDLLWSVLQRGQEISKRDWKLLQVAVVALKGMVYTARLFFGDESGNIVWDCDSRPSDACWLALTAKCPIYIHKEVWHANAVTWRELFKADQGELQTAEESLNSIRPSDPEPVKRLKREMEVALSEEDYSTAVRIRDHPFMMLFRRIREHERAGRTDAAVSLRQQLNELIRETSSAPEGHMEQK